MDRGRLVNTYDDLVEKIWAAIKDNPERHEMAVNGLQALLAKVQSLGIGSSEAIPTPETIPLTKRDYEVEVMRTQEALEAANGNVDQAAEILKVSRGVVIHRMHKYNLESGIVCQGGK